LENIVIKRRRNGWILIVGIIGGALLLGILTYSNYQYAMGSPGGNDFLVHWVGTRAYFVDGISPYSNETALRIQTIAYGRPAQAGEHELRVAYPLYSVFLFFPYAMIPDFTLARAIWNTTLEVALVGLAFLSMRFAKWKPGLILTIVFLLFTLFWYHGIRPLINGNAVILVAVMVCGGLIALQRKSDEAAAILLGLSTIKPQVVLLVLVFAVYWAFFQHRWKFIIWLMGTIILLSAMGMLLIPDWILQNLREVIRYPGYNPPGTPGAAFEVWLPATGQKLGLVLSGILGIMLLLEWWFARYDDDRRFRWAASLTLAVSPWIGIQNDPGNYILLLPALVFFFSILDEKWRRVGKYLIFSFMILLGVFLWVIFLETLTYDYQPQQSPVMIFLLPGFLILGLYWIRWWTIKPARLWADRLTY
jgi:hypothetical protein